MSLYEQIVQLLLQEGFGLEQLQDQADPTEALFIKPRPGGSTIYVTVPLHCDTIPNSVIRRIMITAGIPEPKYRHLLAQDEGN